MVWAFRNVISSLLAGAAVSALLLSLLGAWHAEPVLLAAAFAIPMAISLGLLALIAKSIPPAVDQPAPHDDSESSDPAAFNSTAKLPNLNKPTQTVGDTVKLQAREISSLAELLGDRNSGTIVISREVVDGHSSSDVHVSLLKEHPEGPSELDDKHLKLEFLHATLRTIPGIFVYHMGQDANMVSGGMRSLLGFTIKEVEAMPESINSVIHPDDRIVDAQDEADWIAKGAQGLLIRRSRFKHKDGHWVWLEDRMVGEVDATGKLLSKSGVTLNVTNEVSALEDAKLANQRADLALSAAGFGIWEFNLEAGLLQQSDFCLQMLGSERDENSASLEFWRSRVHPDDFTIVGNSFDEMIQGKREGYESTVRVRHFNGSYIHLQTLARVSARNASGIATRVIGIVRDVSGRVRRENTARETEKKMQESQRLESLGMLAGGIAHDFNNYLGAIMGYASLALSSIDERDPAHRQIQSAISGAERANDLTRQLLAYSGRTSTRIEPVDLGEILASISRLIRVSISRKVDLSVTVPDDLPPVLGDRAQLQQVILNLITNASDAIGDMRGEITVSATPIEVTSEERLAWRIPGPFEAKKLVQVSVVDSGVGMDDETSARLFEPFFTTKPSGHGLGLAALTGIVRSHHGGIDVQTKAGAGTTFHVYLPISEVPVVRPASTPSVKMEAHDLRILAVDDDEMIRDFVKDLLTSHGHHVILAKDGQEAVDTFKASPEAFDIVLMDLTMPIRGGVEAAEEIQALRPNLPVVLTSGYRESDTIGDLTERANLYFLQKPYFPEDLLAKIEIAKTLGSS